MIDYHTNYFKNNTLTLTHSNPCDNGIVNSGYSTIFLRDASPAVDKSYFTPKITDCTLNGSTIMSSYSVNLTDISIPTKAQKSHMFSSLIYRSLLSVGQFYDSGYICWFDKKKSKCSIQPHSPSQSLVIPPQEYTWPISNNWLDHPLFLQPLCTSF